MEKIKKIQIVTAKLAEDLLAGMYHSAFKGQGMEFEEVREYQPGDDVRSIDWNVTARHNRPFVKSFREEREITVMLVVDVSSSTRFGSGKIRKRELIAEIGAILAFSAIQNNDKVGMILFSSEVEKYIPPKKGTRHILRLIRELLEFEPKKKGSDIKSALNYMGNIQRRAGVCFLISDFICDLHPSQMATTAKHYDLISIAVNDPAEVNFPNLDLVQIEDLETGEQQIVDTSDLKVRLKFQELAQERLQNIEKLMQKVGGGFISVKSDTGYLDPIRKFFKLRRIRH